MSQPQKPGTPVAARLSLFDAVNIIIGIVVGVSIFKVPFLVFGNVQTAWGGLGVWALGGALSFIGALCYAELATAYPRLGGDYVYLSKAYGSWVGFLFGWAQLAVILTASIGAMAFVFGDYAVTVFPPPHTVVEKEFSQPLTSELSEEQIGAVQKIVFGPAPQALSDEQSRRFLGDWQPPKERLEALKLAILSPPKALTLEQQILVRDQLKLSGDQLKSLREAVASPPGSGVSPEQLEFLKNQLAIDSTSTLSARKIEAFSVGSAAESLTPAQVSLVNERLARLPELKKDTVHTKELWTALLAVLAVVVLTVTNVSGVIWGKTVQNLLSVAKVVGLAAIVLVGFAWGSPAELTSTKEVTNPSLGMALIFVLYAFGGWNDAAFVAAEVRNMRRNLPLALLLGTAGITVIYLLVNAAYLWGLGLDGLRGSPAPAAALLDKVAGSLGSTVISLLVMVSALGAVNGLVFTGSRVYSTLGADHSLFAALGRWNARVGSPVWSLAAQAAITVVLILGVGIAVGRNAIDSLLLAVGLSSMPWETYFGGFDTLVAGTAPVFWLFFLLTGLSVFALREKDRATPRPFPVPWYPFVPFVFCLTCSYMLYSSVVYAKGISLLGILPLLVGVPLYFLSRQTTTRAPETAPVETSPQEAS